MRRSHRGTRDGVGGVLGANPGGKNVKTWGKDVIALSVVGEVGTFIVEGGGTDSDSILSCSRGVVAGVGVVVTGSHSEVDTSVDSSVDGHVEGGGLATSQAHVGSAALEALLLAVLSGRDGLRVSLSGVLDALDDIGHSTRAVGAEDLDGVYVCLLGNTVLLAGNGTRAVSAMAVAILVGIAARDGLSPLGTALEVDVLNVCAGIDDVNVNTLTTVGSVQVLVVGAEAQGVAVRDTGQTPGGVLLDLRLVGTEDVDLRVALDVGNLSGRVSAKSYAGTLSTDAVTCESDGLHKLPWLRTTQPIRGRDCCLGREVRWSATYIGVLSDLLDGLLVKVTRVTLHAGHLVCVLETVKDVVGDGELSGALSQLHALLRVLGVDALDPVMVLGGILDVLLEDDHVAVGNLLCGS